MKLSTGLDVTQTAEVLTRSITRWEEESTPGSNTYNVYTETLTLCMLFGSWVGIYLNHPNTSRRLVLCQARALIRKRMGTPLTEEEIWPELYG